MANTFAHTHTANLASGTSSHKQLGASEPLWLQKFKNVRAFRLAMHPGWSCLAAAAVEQTAQEDVLSQELSDSVSEAASRVWWARVLLHHTHTLGLKIPNSEAASPVKVLSACTGSFAEGACFKERVGFPMRRLRQWGQGVIKSSVVNFRLSLGPK